MLALPFKKNPPANGHGTIERNGSAPAGFDMAKFEALIARADRAAEQLRTLDASADRAAQLSAMNERIEMLERTLAGDRPPRNAAQSAFRTARPACRLTGARRGSDQRLGSRSRADPQLVRRAAGQDHGGL